MSYLRHQTNQTHHCTKQYRHHHMAISMCLHELDYPGCEKDPGY